MVDDEAGLRDMLRVLLSRAGYDVEIVEGQTRAVALIACSDPFDVVITDLSMPDGSGMGVLQEARRVDDATQVVMVTAYATTAQ
ncbi:response regulator, partial [Acetobacter lovaniensis]|uniref:response regulator n=1 Tax=Acetobacter lovaniensis TaxID=104100 RepID=UPI00377041AE